MWLVIILKVTKNRGGGGGGGGGWSLTYTEHVDQIISNQWQHNYGGAAGGFSDVQTLTYLSGRRQNPGLLN